MPKLIMEIQQASIIDNIPSKTLFRKWARKTIRIDSEVTLRIVDEPEGLMLNQTFRGKDYATNVLTFNLSEEPHLIGDIVICAPVVSREAKEQNKSLEAHFAHLTVHGILHMHGYDHESSAEAELMESIETQILTNLGYADPYS